MYIKVQIADIPRTHYLSIVWLEQTTENQDHNVNCWFFTIGKLFHDSVKRLWSVSCNWIHPIFRKRPATNSIDVSVDIVVKVGIEGLKAIKI
jgi:hypothetical protein